MVGESRLIQQLQNKNQKALEKLIDKYSAYAGTIIRNISRNILTEEDVEEITADVFISIWNNTDKLISGKLQPYIASIARNKAKSRLRQYHETVSLEDTIPISKDSLEEKIDNNILKEVLAELLESLSEKDYEIMVRYYYYYQTISEIADVLDMSDSAIKVRLHRGRKKLQQLFIERGYSYDTEHI